MSVFPNIQKLTKAALMYFDVDDPVPKPRIIRFQYNPDTLTRSLQGQTGGAGEGSAMETLRIDAPPIETITVDIELDATDQLEHPDKNPDSVTMGIFPQLSALEMLLYPKSSQVLETKNLLSQGKMQIIPPQGPLTLFVSGPFRIIPIKLTKCDITEEAHDTRLNPIRAKVSLGMQVLSYSNFDPSHPGYGLFLMHHKVKEAMSIVGQISNLL